MAKVKFKFGNEVTLAEVPDYLKIIDDLTNQIAQFEMEKRSKYPKKKFFEMFLAEEDDTAGDRGYDYLVDELTKVYCEKTKADYDTTMVTGLLRLKQEDIEAGIEIVAEVETTESFKEFEKSLLN